MNPKNGTAQKDRSSIQNGTERDGMERNGTERNGTGQNGTGQNGTEQERNDKKEEGEKNDLAEDPRSRTEWNDFKKVGTCPALDKTFYK